MSTTLMQKPKLTFAQIINMSVGFFGIQFAFGLQNANVSRIFQSLGAKIDEIPILWIAAPLTGLLMQPIVGYFSDRTWSKKWGRRRPYFMAGAILSALALFFFPSCGLLWMAALTLWLLDASINISMEPFRAFVGDMLPNEQRTIGFAAQSFFIGIGAVISSALPYFLTKMGISNESVNNALPQSVAISFYIGAFVFMASIAYTVFTTKEYSPEELASFETNNHGNTTHEIVIKNSHTTFSKNGIIWLVIGSILSFLLFRYNSNNASNPLEKELYVLTLGIAAFGIFQLLAANFLKSGNKNGLVEIIDDLFSMPNTMKQLAVIQFFTWFALFAMWIYSTPALAMHLANTTDAKSTAFNDIGNWVGVLFGFYNGFAALSAFLLPVLAKKIGQPKTYMVCLIAGGLGLISYYFFNNQNMLIFSMLGVGIAWAGILAMPYSILTEALPSNKMGVFMGIFNFFIVIPQILAATLLGFFTKHLFDGKVIYTIVLGGVSMLIAAILCLRVKAK
jgi:maltose/moltooligosaccharide transporter